VTLSMNGVFSITTICDCAECHLCKVSQNRLKVMLSVVEPCTHKIVKSRLNYATRWQHLLRRCFFPTVFKKILLLEVGRGEGAAFKLCV
jgi:hypothetical protein